ncbi:hypothetical protein IMZ48_22350 [Candidatus Bathyarchaeota archaeon]|nr:hypothetical protein [Candidatus Bathyarchaeota archaeon]
MTDHAESAAYMDAPPFSSHQHGSEQRTINEQLEHRYQNNRSFFQNSGANVSQAPRSRNQVGPNGVKKRPPESPGVPAPDSVSVDGSAFEYLRFGSGPPVEAEPGDSSAYSTPITHDASYQEISEMGGSLSPPVPDGKQQHRIVTIGADIRAKLLEHPALHNPQATVSTSFLLEDWTPRHFIEKQAYDLPYEKILDHVICVTGTWRNAQAMTVAEYMAQTWPRTSQGLLALMNNVLSGTTAQEYRCMYYKRLEGGD